MRKRLHNARVAVWGWVIRTLLAARRRWRDLQRVVSHGSAVVRGRVVRYRLAARRNWRFGHSFLRDEHPRLGKALLGLLGLLGLAFAWRLVAGYVEPTTPEQRTTLLQTVAQIAGGILLGAGLYYTAQNARTNREGQITERFTRAIDQLGSTDKDGKALLEIRLGAIYALERIARDSPRDHWPIMEVLTAYVRQNARRTPVDPFPPPLTPDEVDQMEYAAQFRSWQPGGLRARADIQAIMTVIGRTAEHAGRLKGQTLNLAGADLQHVDLTHAQLQGAMLRAVDLRGAELSYTQLEGVYLSEAELAGVDLSFTRLRGVWMYDANLEGAQLYGAELEGAGLANSCLSRAKLSGARLRGTVFVGADLSSADFEGAFLDRASFRKASSLDGAVFKDAHLDEADFRETDLRRTIGLTRAQIDVAITDHTTLLPDYLAPAAASPDDATVEGAEDGDGRGGSP